MTRSEILSVAKPILFNTEMVRAIKDNRKTVTRRIAFPNKDLHEFDCAKYPTGWWYKGRVYENWNNLLHDLKREKFCKYQVGDILYVRETWFLVKYRSEPDDEKMFYYRADGEISTPTCHWKPSIHMPKEAARIFLRVTGVWVERLQDISSEQIDREGINCDDPYVLNGVEKRYDYQQLWNSTVKKSDLDKYGWETNPWVWVIEFERVEVE